jgi:carbonic anhydrase
MHELVRGIHKFQDDVFRPKQEFFKRLAQGQHPQALFITCSDSRIDPNLLTRTEPGELFILRNVGNIVPPFTPTTADGGVAAAVEFAVSALGVENIIVCGHSLCGAMKGLLHPENLEGMPSVGGWLAHAETTRRIVQENYRELDDDEQLNVAVQENVLVQVENLRTHPAVAARLARGGLNLYAWVYKLETGEVYCYQCDQGQFVSLSDQTSMPTVAAARSNLAQVI